jgi:LAO/AO transport system kinase
MPFTEKAGVRRMEGTTEGTTEGATQMDAQMSALAAGVLAGDRLSIARAISRAEREEPEAHALLAALHAHSGRAHVVGVTGAPGSGKSTLVTVLAQRYRAAGMTVAIVAVDPSSPFTGGAVLGDRVRMAALSGDPGVFIRSMATRGSLGGLSKTTGEAVAILDAAGFERILVETVGVGQAEIDIAATAHTTLVVEAPGMGDEVQAIKAGILEIADVLVVNKADRTGADRTVKALQLALEMENAGGKTLRHHGQWMPAGALPADEEAQAQTRWRVPICKTVAADGTGVEEVRGQIEMHRAWLVESGEMASRERMRARHRIELILRAEINRRILAQLPAEGMHALVDEVCQFKLDPYGAAERLLSKLSLNLSIGR